MSDAAAPPQAKGDEDESSSQSECEIVPFFKPASLEYDGEAGRVMAQFSQLAITVAAKSTKKMPAREKKRAIQLLEKLAESMELIEEHISVLEVHADLIIECMSDDERVYFTNDSKGSAHTVTSLLRKRCKSLRVQKFFLRKSGQALPVVQDNDEQQLIDCEGSLACSVKVASSK